LHGERIDDRCHHAHVIRRGTVHAGGGTRDAAEDIAAADDDADLDAQFQDVFHLVRDPLDHDRVQAELPVAHQGFAGEL